MMANRYGASARYIKIMQADGSKSYLPLLVRDVRGCLEAFSAHGYGGIFGDKLIIKEADVDDLSNFIAESGICCIFLRHSPFLANHKLWPANALSLNRITYQVSLSKHHSTSEYMGTLHQKLRASIKHAIRSHLRYERVSSVSLIEDLATFHSLYVERMKKRNADSFYRFDLAFMYEHLNQLGQECILTVIRSDLNNNIVAGALFLVDHEYGHVHYHLSAASDESMRHQSMELLLGMAIYDFGMEGFQLMHLGGGHILDEMDGLSRFKRKFSTGQLPFYISKIVCDQEIYARQRQSLSIKSSGLFLPGDAIGAHS